MTGSHVITELTHPESEMASRRLRSTEWSEARSDPFLRVYRH